MRSGTTPSWMSTRVCPTKSPYLSAKQLATSTIVDVPSDPLWWIMPAVIFSVCAEWWHHCRLVCLCRMMTSCRLVLFGNFWNISIDTRVTAAPVSIRNFKGQPSTCPVAIKPPFPLMVKIKCGLQSWLAVPRPLGAAKLSLTVQLGSCTWHGQLLHNSNSARMDSPFGCTLFGSPQIWSLIWKVVVVSAAHLFFPPTWSQIP